MCARAQGAGGRRGMEAAAELRRLREQVAAQEAALAAARAAAADAGQARAAAEDALRELRMVWRPRAHRRCCVSALGGSPWGVYWGYRPRRAATRIWMLLRHVDRRGASPGVAQARHARRPRPSVASLCWSPPGSRKSRARAANPARAPQTLRACRRRARKARCCSGAPRRPRRRRPRSARRPGATCAAPRARPRTPARRPRGCARPCATCACAAARPRWTRRPRARGAAARLRRRCGAHGPCSPPRPAGRLRQGGAAWRGAARKRRAGDHVHGKPRPRMGRAAVQMRCCCSHCSNFLGMRGMHAVQAGGTAGSVPCTTAPGPAGVMIRARSLARRAASQRPSL